MTFGGLTITKGARGRKLKALVDEISADRPVMQLHWGNSSKFIEVAIFTKVTKLKPSSAVEPSRRQRTRTNLIAMTDHGTLAREIAAFEAHHPELATTAAGKYALVYGDEIAAIHDTERLAISDGREPFGYVPILVEYIWDEGKAGPPAETVRVHDQPGESPSRTISWGQSRGGLHHFGPVAAISAGMTDADARLAGRSGKSVPELISGGGLIDTGATFSHLDAQLIARLGLQPVGRLDLAGFDDVKTELRYEVKIVIENKVFIEIIVGSSQLRRTSDIPIPNYDFLIGRDVLANSVMTYDGVRGAVTLQFGTPRLDDAHPAG